MRRERRSACTSVMRSCALRVLFQLVNVPCTALVEIADLPFEFCEVLLESLHAAQHVALAVLYDMN